MNDNILLLPDGKEENTNKHESVPFLSRSMREYPSYQETCKILIKLTV
jgi:hypothetical protein